jgi:hypothetical protein
MKHKFDESGRIAKNHLTRARLALALAAGLSLAFSANLAAGPLTRVTGGGTGSYGADLDGDGETDGSHFGMGVLIGNDFATGHFECLMAGNADLLGLPLMAVEGKVTEGSVADDSATFGGVATVNLANGRIFRDIQFTVTVTAGEASVGTLQLSVIGVFDGVPGDEVRGNGNYDLPVETVATGQIRIE